MKLVSRGSPRIVLAALFGLAFIGTSAPVQSQPAADPFVLLL
jgi:hypothetical protein